MPSVARRGLADEGASGGNHGHDEKRAHEEGRMRAGVIRDTLSGDQFDEFLRAIATRERVALEDARIEVV
jgi:hypothetical protein